MHRRPCLLALLALACGPNVEQVHGDPDVAAPPPVDAEPPDARIPPADVAPLSVTMWVHSADTLYRMDDATLSLTLIGLFGNDDPITDLAVAPDGTLYGISETKLYRIDGETAAATYLADVPGLTNVGLTFI